MTSKTSPRLSAVLLTAALVAASCSSGSDSSPQDSVADSVTSEAVESVSTDAVDGAEADDGDSGDVTPGSVAEEVVDADVVDVDDDGRSAIDDSNAPEPEGFEALAPATGELIRIGMVNTEGVPGLDFPDLRTDTELAVTYLNEHGGMGGRPVELVHCTAAGSPESSQACAQELTGQDVEMVMLGLDLFPGYDTFSAASLPVFGALPILPGDYTADALFVTGGNATTMTAMVTLAVEHLDAQSVGIISADNPGANSSVASLTAALDKAGIGYASIKGGDTETDAGFQGLMREVDRDNPDLIMSLYDDAGCIGAMRGRAALEIDTPVVTTGICSSAIVLGEVGDDATGWHFVGAAAQEDTPAADAFNTIIEPAYGDGLTSSIGIGSLGIQLIMSLARVSNQIAEAGGEVTGPAIYETLQSSNDLRLFPNDNVVACGVSPTYPSVCSFELPIGRYVAGGTIETVPGFAATSVLDYLP